MSKMLTDQLVGITETSDPCFHLDLFDNLCKANIIITKRLTDKLIDKLVEHKDKCILHLTCTGLGGSKIEPMAPTKEVLFKKFNELIDKGFPVNQVVLRIDPIIATVKGVETGLSVIELFKDSGITRIRYSALDMYKHVIDRFKDNDIRIPHNTFHANINMRRELDKRIRSAASLINAQVEVCAEPGIESTGCISQKDIDILGLTNDIKLIGKKDQRKECSCPNNKKQLITETPAPCGNACLYCFWKKY